MSDPTDQKPAGEKRILIKKNGSYRVEGNPPLVRKTQVVSEHGEPLTWKLEGAIETGDGDHYSLCRCGESSKFPFCDGTHRQIGFDDANAISGDQTGKNTFKFPGGTRLIVKKDPSLCMSSGYCGLRNASLRQIVAGSSDSRMRALAMAMVERCPSGALTYQIEEGEADIEPDLPQQIALTTEITSEGPIEGPVWVTGYLPIVRADGEPFEARNRVTLCNCGHSKNKPLCDGTHRREAKKLGRMK